MNIDPHELGSALGELRTDVKYIRERMDERDEVINKRIDNIESDIDKIKRWFYMVVGAAAAGGGAFVSVFQKLFF